MVRRLADKAVAQAADGPLTRPRAGEVRVRMSAALPVARRLLGQDADAGPGAEALREAVAAFDAAEEADPNGYAAGRTRFRFVDGRGHHRGVYQALFLALQLRAMGESERERFGHEALALGVTAFDVPPASESPDVAAVLWGAYAAAWGGGTPDVAAVRWASLDATLGPRDADGPLRERPDDEPPDDWTYRELTGLHALDGLSRMFPGAGWGRRVAAAARWHQAHTQPDYTTYQPWALAAFLSQPETVPFAEQQLHDVETHLAIGGGAGAVVAALLLADAWAAVGAGRVGREAKGVVRGRTERVRDFEA